MPQYVFHGKHSMKKPIVEQYRATKEEKFKNPVYRLSCNTFNWNVILQCFSIYVCMNWDNSSVVMVERTYKTTEQTCNTWTPPACHTCMTFAEVVIMTNQVLLKIPPCWFRAAQYKQKRTSELLVGTKADFWNTPLQQKHLRRTCITILFALLCYVTWMSCRPAGCYDRCAKSVTHRFKTTLCQWGQKNSLSHPTGLNSIQLKADYLGY